MRCRHLSDALIEGFFCMIQNSVGKIIINYRFIGDAGSICLAQVVF